MKTIADRFALILAMRPDDAPFDMRATVRAVANITGQDYTSEPVPDRQMTRYTFRDGSAILVGSANTFSVEGREEAVR